MKIAQFRLDEDLASLARRGNAGGEFPYRFAGPQSLKHLIESLGIPHTEIGALYANGNAVDPDYLVQDGDQIQASGVPSVVDPGDEPRFVSDGHLGRLASQLRMLGLDCLYRSDYEDAELAQISMTEGRNLLSRDRRLLMRKTVRQGYLVRSLVPSQQAREIVSRFGLKKWIRPFQRCIRCNQLLRAVDKQDILARLEPLTRRYFDDFRLCPRCGQIYWGGSHVEHMRQTILNITGDLPNGG